ncbi:tumor necrosis factor receptor superfamily member 5 [Xenopus laevis]|uniref:Tumor necrosis factor receptor superfamily member 5 n=1 Tax=Xenopus laevis TaxID=8355 RepID=A0A8J0U2I7_XENLA|nr:tumor necrosis factor receptor superfamily member 5 [Xenopus laevis]
MRFLQLCLLLLLSYIHKGTALTCSDRKYLKDGECCSLCSPGKRMSQECDTDSETVCENCRNGEFQDKWNRESTCHQHAYCDPNAGKEQVTEGTTERNVECQCQNGRHCSGPTCEICLQNTPCSPGYGVTQKATNTSDTQCSPCAEGSFSNTTSYKDPCIIWKSCENEEEELLPGNSTRDKVCRMKSHRNHILIIVGILIFVTSLIIAATYLLRNKCRIFQTKKEKQQVPQMNGHKLVPTEDNDPEAGPIEDCYPLADTSAQGHPVAQEVGKDSHMSQEER